MTTIFYLNLQVAQLLGFSQLPVEDSESPILDPSPYPTQLTTFSANSDCKLQSPSTSTNQLQQLAINAFDEAYNNQLRYRGLNLLSIHSPMSFHMLKKFF